MRRREFIGLVGGALAWPLAARAQQDGKLPRIAYLNPGFPSAPAKRNAEIWQDTLGEQGWVEGRNCKVEYFWGEEQPNKLRELAGDVIKSRYDIIFTLGRAVVTVSALTKTIPIVAVDLETDPIKEGVVSSLARPGGNVTGVFLDAPELTAKHVELIREVAPGITRIAVLGNPLVNAEQFKAVDEAGRLLAIEMKLISFQQPEELEGMFAVLTGARSEGLIALPSPLMNGQSRGIAELAARTRIPAISMFRAFPEAGGLMQYGPKLAEMFRRATAYVDKILRGATPGDLPIERPPRFELVLNLTAARKAGLNFPAQLLARADEVIE